jgi:RNA polymerase sigma-70 factor (ECF subfamily)
MSAHFDEQTGTTLELLLRNPASQQAWAAFVDRYGPRICGWCRRWHLQEDDAEDVTQEVLLRLHRGLGTFNRARGRFRGWLRAVVSNALKDHLESRQRYAVGLGRQRRQALPRSLGRGQHAVV